MNPPPMTLKEWIKSKLELCERASRPPWFVHPESGEICHGNPQDDRENYPLDDPDDDALICDARTTLPLALKMLARAVEKLNCRCEDDAIVTGGTSGRCSVCKLMDELETMIKEKL